MLIKFFRSSFIIQYAALFFITVSLWIPAFLHPLPLPEEGSLVAPVYDLIYRIMPDIPWLPAAIALLLVFAEALILNSIFIYHDLVPKNTLLPSLIFILLMSSGNQSLTLYPVIIAILPLTFFLHTLYEIYEESHNLNKVLGVGLMAAITSMIYAPLVLLLLFTWIAFLVYRSLQWREWLVALIGFALPYVYLGTYYFWMDRLGEISSLYVKYFGDILIFKVTMDPIQMGIWGIFSLLIFLPAVFRVSATLGGFNIAFRRRMAATVWMAVFGAIMIVSPGDIFCNNLIYLPATGILAHFYSSMKRPVLHEIILLLYLAAIGFHNYNPL
jgi:hypothetical protein